MGTATILPKTMQMIVTLENNTVVAEVKKAREVFARGKTLVCNIPEKM